MTLSSAERARYERQISLSEIGLAGQERLKSARVLVIGAGGLGSPVALYLAAAGVGALGIVDCDRVALSNLHRQVLFESASLGRLKAEAARERLASLNPQIEVIAHALELRSGNVRAVLEPYDVIVDGTDRLSTRYLVNDACVILGKPLVSAAIHRFEGQALTYVPGRGPCYRCLFPEARDGVVASCAEAGVLGVLPGVLGAIQATEAIKLVTGVGEPLTGRLLTYDALEMRFREFSLSRRPDCAVCGEHPSITEPLEAGERCAGEAAQALGGVLRLSPAQLHGLIEGTREPLVLIDVREPDEFGIGRLAGAINIPLAELAGRLEEIPRTLTPVFICRSGRRSLAACAAALSAGIQAPAHLEGGLAAWAMEIDPAFPLDPPGGGAA
ncbi:MAG TPA: molybdopterin-synthase adenylyltransferase MoeB [Steroidobacteraceae bacterium]|nr:molybdopterin-synthase adenylyltransferase MoeB [Steroidobacteraceae bacterium]